MQLTTVASPPLPWRKHLLGLTSSLPSSEVLRPRTQRGNTIKRLVQPAEFRVAMMHHSPALNTKNDKRLQRGEKRGYSLSPQGLPSGPRVQLVLEVLEGPRREKKK